MAAKQDYYELLGVAKNADATAIKKAYRKLAKKYHPDTNAGDPAAEQKFKDVTEAYTICSMQCFASFLIKQTCAIAFTVKTLHFSIV